MKRILLFVLIATLSINTTFSKDSSNRYYDHVHLGEKKFDDYFGPWDPSTYSNKLDGSLSFKDNRFKDEFFDSYIQRGITPFSNLWLKEIPVKSSCPDFYLDKNIDYIRYLFRLVTMSYLYEGLKQSHFRLYSLGLEESKCHVKIKKIFKSCRPKTMDMRKFISRARAKKFTSISPDKYKRFNKATRKAWIDTYSNSTNGDLAAFRSDLVCMSNPELCVSSVEKRIQETLDHACKEDTGLIQKICSEEDDLYGASYVELVIDLLNRSNAAKVINMGGHGLQCLQRYVNIFRERERFYYQIPDLFPVVFAHIKRQNQRYDQGELFLPGALREFDDKGLADFLFMPKPKPRVKPKPIVVKKVEPPKPTPKPVVVVKKVVAKKPAPVVKKKVVKKIKKLSAFEQAIVQRIKFKFQSAPVNMKRFKNELKFSAKVLKALEEPLKVYQTRSALTDMLKYDDLGSREEPVRLMFVKYLIEKNLHQGLFNVIGVIGERFFVVNDLESKKESVYVELKNDESTGFQWKLSVLSDPPPQKEEEE